MAKEVTSIQLQRAGLSRSFADHVLAGTRKVSVPLALWLLEEHGLRVGPVQDKTRAEVRLLRSMYEPKAPTSILRRAANDTQTRSEAA